MPAKSTVRRHWHAFEMRLTGTLAAVSDRRLRDTLSARPLHSSVQSANGV